LTTTQEYTATINEANKITTST